MTAHLSAFQRKEKTEQLLQSLGVPINRNLPLVESEAEARFKNSKEVAKRAVALYFLIAVAHGENRNDALTWLKSEDLSSDLSPQEREFFENGNPSKEKVIAATWRVEGLWILLWALGKVATLDLPTDLCDTQMVQELMSWIDQDSSSTFIDSAKLRHPNTILDESDLIYRIHWAVVEAQLNNEEVPCGFHPGVVYERHYALNWLTGYSDEWDEVTTDT